MTEHLGGIISQLQQQKMAIEQALEALQRIEEIEVHGPRMGTPATRASADDYGTKPFNTRELAAHTRSALVNSRASSAQSDEPLSVGDLELFPERRLVLKSGEPVYLPPKQFKFLYYLMSHAGYPLTHSEMLHAVWGSEHEYTNGGLPLLRTLVRDLRKTLEDDAGNPKYLLTVNHFGYRFMDPARAPRADKRAVVPNPR